MCVYKSMITIFMLSVFFSAGAFGTVFVSPSGNDTTGNSWATAFHSIQAAIDAVPSAGGEVWVAEGNYILLSSLQWRNNVALYGGFPNSGTSTMPDRNPKVHVTVLNGMGSTQHVISLDHITNPRIDGVVITGGSAPNTSSEGGGILCLNGSGTFTIANCVVENNETHSGASGAGIYIDHSTVVIENTLVRNNESSQHGGGLFCNYCTLSLSNCVFEDNTSSQSGAGVEISHTTGVISSCRFSRNQGTYEGGGMFLFSDQSIQIVQCIFEDNQCNSIGGSIMGYNTPLIIEKSTFYRNTAWRGGAIHSHESPKLDVSNSLFVENVTTTSAGAIYTENFGRRATITHCTFVGNTCQTQGGAMYITNAPATIVNSIFVNNGKYAVSEMNGGSDATLLNCLFFNNADGDFYDGDTAMGYTSADGPTGFEASVSEAVGNFDADPRFVNAASDDYHIMLDSPAIDRGYSADMPVVDFDGDTRPVYIPGFGGDEGWDIGYDEYVISASDDSDFDGVSDLDELTFGYDPLNALDKPSLPVGGGMGLGILGLFFVWCGGMKLKAKK